MAHSAHKSEAFPLPQGAESQPQAGITAVLRNRNFLFLWLAQLFSQLAQQIINFALVVQVERITESATAIAGIVICFTVPGVVFSAIAGVFVDRQSKRRVLVVTNVARGVVVLLYILTTVLPAGEVGLILPILYVNTLVFSAIGQFFVPAEGAAIPLLVKRNELIAANSLFNLTFTAAQLIGFAFLGPILVQLLGFQWLYIVLFALYAVCAVLTWLLPEVDPAREASNVTKLDEKVKVAWDELKEGWGYIRRDNALVTAITYWSVAITVFMMLATIGTTFLRTVLDIEAEHLTFILVPGGLGLVVGVIAVGKLATESNRTLMIRLGLLFGAILLFVFAVTHPTIQLIAGWMNRPDPGPQLSQLIMGSLAFLLGITNSFITVPAQTVLQERSPEHVRARVFSAFYTVSNTLLIIPLVAAGAMADILGAVQTVVIIAVLMAIMVAVTWRLGANELEAQGVSLEPGDEAGEALLPGTVPLPLDDERTHTLHIGETTPPEDGGTRGQMAEGGAQETTRGVRADGRGQETEARGVRTEALRAGDEGVGDREQGIGSRG